ncbi:MAG: hypothetical protein K6E30_11295 [Lachnospiraceae bacterium]|nr:hypothetical protein [Lachnospiraceae bacterium]
MLFGMTFYQILFYFAVYSVGGWCVEVFYHALCCGTIVNRGFLNGPVCPIYGCGALSIFAMTNLIGNYVTKSSGRVEDTNLAVLFLGGMLLATLIELIGGYVLDALFHMRWWDYSKQPYNFRGYICLKFSVLWGMGAAFVIRVLQPGIRNFLEKAAAPFFIWIYLALFYILFFIDLVITVLSINKMNRELAELEGIRKSLRRLSDGMTEAIGKTSQVIGESQVQAALAKAELRDAVTEKRDEYREAMDKKKAEYRDGLNRKMEEYQARTAELYREFAKRGLFGPGRILRAFPEMIHHDYEDALEMIRKKLDEKETNKAS